jgi:hypothetical protein
MPLRRMTGGENAAAAWAMPDDSIVFVKLTQKQYLAAAGDMERMGRPSPDARPLMAVGGMPELDTADGYPGPGDYWEMPDGEGGTVLHVQTGTDPFGDWHYTFERQKIDQFTGKVAVDAKGKALTEFTAQVKGAHRDVLTVYDIKNIGLYAPRTPVRVASFAVTDVEIALPVASIQLPGVLGVD